MPVRDFPFMSLHGQLRPLLPIIIINPHTRISLKTLGIIDTGADSCTLSAEIAEIIGHNLEDGFRDEAEVVGGKVQSWRHTTTVQMLDFTGKTFHTIDSAQIEYIRNFDYVILGIKDFLENFCLEIDYPNKCFSIRFSEPKKKIKVSAP